MLDDAGKAYQQAVRANPHDANQNAGLVSVGTAAAIERGGGKALQEFIRVSGAGASSNPKVLFELANAELMVGAAVPANEYVQRALGSPTLVAEDLASPWQAAYGDSNLLVTAAALRAAGDAAACERRLDELAALLDRLEQAGMQTHGVFVLRAQLAAMRGQADAAMTALQRAAQLGWGAVWLADHQPYFEPLRQRADYRQLLATARARNAATAASIRSQLAPIVAPAG
jgi:hypothetical protein